MKTKLLALLLAIATLTTVFCFTGCDVGGAKLEFASNGDGTCSVRLANDNKATDIVIPDKSPDGDKVTVVDYFHSTLINSVVIPDSVTTINANAFRESSDLTSVTIGNNVVTIGEEAFKDCKALTSITIPDKVTAIAESTFLGCKSLTSATIGNGVKSIAIGAFDCESLASVKFGSGVEEIDSCAFITTALNSITVDSNNPNYYSEGNCLIEKSSNTLVLGCNSSVIPDGVERIGEYAFSYCAGLTSVDIPDTVTKIGKEAFHNCSGLTSVTLGDGLLQIGEAAFLGCSALTDITIPAGVTGIGPNVFASCSSLSGITFMNPNGWHAHKSQGGENIHFDNPSWNAQHLTGDAYWNYSFSRDN